ncbi:MAG TPA: glycogen-binding domain-containing protein [Polyangia bacterium]|jgi:hypothetical protein
MTRDDETSFLRSGDGPLEELTSLRELSLPPSLVARVMTSVATPPPRGWRQLLRRTLGAELRISAAAALLAVTALVGGTAFVVRTQAPHTVAAGATTGASASVAIDDPRSILVRFVFESRGAKQVSVAGSFNDWTPAALNPSRDGDGFRAGLFVATIPLSRGVHEYMFIVDGKWMRDPMISDSRPDGFGRQNSLLRL